MEEAIGNRVAVQCGQTGLFDIVKIRAGHIMWKQLSAGREI